MFQRIMIAIDDSDLSRRALAEAIRLAALYGASLHIVHAVEGDLGKTLGAQGAALAHGAAFDQALLGQAHALLDKAAADAIAEGVTATQHLLSAAADDATDQVAAEVSAHSADLLIVGSHGRRGLSRLLQGSVAESLLRKIEISVFIVRGDPPAPAG